MVKKLVGFYRPAVAEDMTEKDKKEAREDLVRAMVHDIVKAPGSLFQGLSDEELDEIITESLIEDDETEL